MLVGLRGKQLDERCRRVSLIRNREVSRVSAQTLTSATTQFHPIKKRVLRIESWP